MQVGRYQVLEIIGTGAQSRVARGFDPLIGRTVAIKLFSQTLARGEARERFLREARVIGQLSHPGIITLHDLGIEESSLTPYLVMEFVGGRPLDCILEKGSVPFSRACAWAAEVATALDVAHRRGIIHGDVKPGNILIAENGRVKLTDFGMARLASHDTGESALFGTPAYWCPEQIMGKPQDARSDVFSLGVVIYEMVTGARPFDSDSLQGVCQRVLSSTPLPPSHDMPSIPKAFDDLIAEALAKDPVGRIQTAEALAAVLYPLARSKVMMPTSAVKAGLRGRASRLLHSA